MGTNFLLDGDLSDNLILNTLKIPIRYITVRRTSLIIPCQNTSCNILRICFNGSEMTTCLINDQINDKRKMSILSKDRLLESGKLFKKNFQSRSLDTCVPSSTRCPNFFWFVYIKNHAILHMKSKAQKVN